MSIEGGRASVRPVGNSNWKDKLILKKSRGGASLMHAAATADVPCATVMESLPCSRFRDGENRPEPHKKKVPPGVSYAANFQGCSRRQG